MSGDVQVRFCERLGVRFPRATHLVVLCKNTAAAKEARRRVEWILTHKLRLELHPEKTRQVDLRYGRGSFEFLGCTLRKKRSILRNPRLSFLQRWPSPRAMKRIRTRVHELTSRATYGEKDVRAVIARLNPVLRGWANYFRTGNADAKFNQMDDYVHRSVVRWMQKRGGQRPGKVRFEDWPFERLFAMGLVRLRTSVRYPAQATPRRPSVSRVRENREHGLKGECGNTPT
jgi:hypothetical protein